MIPLRIVSALVAISLLAGPTQAEESPETDTQLTGIVQGDAPITYPSKYLDQDVTVLPGVFFPYEGENWVLPMMHEYRDLFEGKSVLEIGTGSGIISLYAAQLGASKVVSTDINPKAVECANLNAKRMGFDGVMRARLVPPEDMSAYSVIADGETFDIIFSNPPYALDLDADINTAVVDTGGLGPSLIRGLDQHLTPDGSAILLYGSLFYHHVMVRFARHEGYEVRYHLPNLLMPWEAQTLYNFYLTTALQREGVDPKGFGFHADLAIPRELTHKAHLEPKATDYQAHEDEIGHAFVKSQYGELFEGRKPKRPHPGFMVVRRK